MGYEIQNSDLSIKSYNVLIKKAVKFYNNRSHSGIGGKSPNYMIKNSQNISNIPADFNYTENKKALLRNKNKISSKIALLTPVRLQEFSLKKNVNKWAKRYSTPYYSNEVLYVNSFKMPTLSSDPVKIILMRKNGDRFINKNTKKGVFSLNDFKILLHNSYKLAVRAVFRTNDPNLIKVKINGLGQIYYLTKAQILKTLRTNKKIIASLDKM